MPPAAKNGKLKSPDRDVIRGTGGTTFQIMSDQQPLNDDEIRRETMRRHIAGLSKHFDALLIIGTRMSDADSTQIEWVGHGNHFARIEMARCFVRNEEYSELSIHIAEQIADTMTISEDDEDDEEDEMGDK
jgi:hypothetical protein